jgi:hypothetical protein
MREAARVLAVIFGCIVFSVVIGHFAACESTADLCAIVRANQ